MRFKEYIAGRRTSFTPQGDFVRFALADERLPDVQCWTQLESHILQAWPGEARRHRVAAEVVWQSFVKAAQRRHAGKLAISFCAGNDDSRLSVG